MRKAAQAFRTISEVAEILQTPAHVLRFWESKFTHVKPVKRAGGRRYYRPADLELLSGIRTLLHDHGMTIRGVQKLLTEKGVRHVADYAPEAIAEVLDGSFDEENDATLADAGGPDTGTAPAPDTDTTTVDQRPDTGSETVAPVESAAAPDAMTGSDDLAPAADVAAAPGSDVSASNDPVMGALVTDEPVTDDVASVSEQPADVAPDPPEHDVADAAAPPQRDAQPASGTDSATTEASDTETPETETPDAALAEPDPADVDVSVPEAVDTGSADARTSAPELEPDGAESGRASVESLEIPDPTSAKPVDETSQEVPDAASDVTTVAAPATGAEVESAPVDALPAYRIAVLLRGAERATMQPPPPEFDALLRRMDALLDRMSKAGGAARW